VHSARYAGPEQDYARNVEKVLRDLAGVPAGRRTARFRTAVALIFPDGREVTVAGECRGMILETPRGAGGFGYDPIFLLPGADKTFAEMSLAEKQRVSHRGAAMRHARRVLSGWLAERR
jgi:XTP/dITP diphosphohydrolase